MGKLVPGGRQYINHTQSDLAEAQALVIKAGRCVRHNPLLVEALLEDASELLTRMQERQVDLELMLERVQVRRDAAGLADRLAALERRVEQMESGGKVVQLRKDG